MLSSREYEQFVAHETPLGKQEEELTIQKTRDCFNMAKIPSREFSILLSLCFLVSKPSYIIVWLVKRGKIFERVNVAKMAIVRFDTHNL